MPFEPAPAKLTLASLDDTKVQVMAHYNPRELELGKQVPWAEHNVMSDHKPATARRDAKANRGVLHLEFTGDKSRSMSLELLFDGFETGTSIEPHIVMLERMASPRDPTAKEEEYRRPHQCLVVWGEQGIRPFRCVIETLTVKYTMFGRTGVPLRALCQVKLKEATRLSTSATEREQYSGEKRKPR
ncbi:MAG: hypothetical protein M3680_07750 [Myxococcota bacterium]|nr:hypothetical protein [Myxococcota bacterium]